MSKLVVTPETAEGVTRWCIRDEWWDDQGEYHDCEWYCKDGKFRASVSYGQILFFDTKIEAEFVMSGLER